ncbi:MAG: ATPase, T2SS/T4P/T4SS family [Vicinamibacterales bacterium]
MTSYVSNQSVKTSATDYWNSEIETELNAMRAINRSLVLRNGDVTMHLRLSLFRHQRSKLGMAIRLIMPPPPLADLGLSKPLLAQLQNSRPRGLLIITGPTASGKTTTALSIFQHLNSTTSGHLVTIEDPIEYGLAPERCAITQREVGTDVTSFGQGLIEAMRHAPEAILASEIRDRDAAEAAIMGGESGALMVVTTHGQSIPGTLRKLLAYCGENADAMRTVLAGGLIGVVRQERVPFKDGSGFGLVHDTLHGTENVKKALAAGDWHVLQRIVRADKPSADFEPMHTKLQELMRRTEPHVLEQVVRAAEMA